MAAIFTPYKGDDVSQIVPYTSFHSLTPWTSDRITPYNSCDGLFYNPVVSNLTNSQSPIDSSQSGFISFSRQSLIYVSRISLSTFHRSAICHLVDSQHSAT